MFTFLQGSTLVIDIAGSGFVINPETVSMSQTFQETNYSSKTLQDRNMINESFIQKRSTASFSFTYFISDNHLDDGHIWEWFGFSKSSSKYSISPVVSNAPVQRDIYLDTHTGKKVKFSNAVVESLEVDLRHDQIAKVVVSVSGTLLEIIEAIPALTGTSHSGSYLGNNYLTIELAGQELQGVIANSLAFRRSVQWLEQPTIHSVQAGEIYVPTIPIQQDLSISGRYTIILQDTSIDTTNSNIKLTTGNLEVYLDNCNISERLGIDKVLTKTLDFKVRPTIITEDSYIQYN